MLPLSQTTGYAVRALQCLQEPGGHPVLVEEVAEYTGIPRSYLSKLIHKLAKKGLVVARRGHHGGVVLARPSTEITLEDLSDAIDGVAWRKRCLMGLLGCGGRSLRASRVLAGDPGADPGPVAFGDPGGSGAEP